MTKKLHYVHFCGPVLSRGSGCLLGVRLIANMGYGMTDGSNLFEDAFSSSIYLSGGKEIVYLN